MTNIVLPKLSQTGTNEWSDVESNDVAIRDVVNGQLDNGNLSGSAGITDANLAAPNNAAYRTILQDVGHFRSAKAAGTYLFEQGGSTPVANGSNGYPVNTLYFDDADYSVSGKTQKLRVRVEAYTNGTAPAITITVGLYPISSVAGSADDLAFTLGAVVSGSTVAFASPSARTATKGDSGDFAIPADGHYCFGAVLSSQLRADAVVGLSLHLQTRHV